MPDFNSDRELGQGKIKYVVRNSKKGLPVRKIQTGKGELELDKKGRCLVSDAGLAAEIRKDHPYDLAVSRVFTEDAADRGHKYFYGCLPALPWQVYDQYGRRIREAEPSEGGDAAQDKSPAEVEKKESEE
jgi:hypothetical protein